METAPIPATPSPPTPIRAAAAGDITEVEIVEIVAAANTAVPPATISEASTPKQLLEQELRFRLVVKQEYVISTLVSSCPRKMQRSNGVPD